MTLLNKIDLVLTIMMILSMIGYIILIRRKRFTRRTIRLLIINSLLVTIIFILLACVSGLQQSVLAATGQLFVSFIWYKFYVKERLSLKIMKENNIDEIEIK